jgi:RNA polymerase sigma-70 factor (ECF subfamily)
MAITDVLLKAGVADDLHARTFAALVDCRQTDAIRLAYRLLGGDQAAAEDVAQNAFLRAWRGLPGFRGAASLDTWFYRILVREVYRYRRWRALRRVWDGDPAEVPEPVDDHPDRDPGLRRRIGHAVASLTRAQRDAFVLVHLEGFGVAETAAILGKAPGTIKSHLHRALDSLRRDLSDLRSEKPDHGGADTAGGAGGGGDPGRTGGRR